MGKQKGRGKGERKGKKLIITKKVIMSYDYANYFCDFKNFCNSVDEDEFSLVFDEVLDLCDYKEENKELIKQFTDFREILSASLDTQEAILRVAGPSYGEIISEIFPELNYKEDKNFQILLLKEAKRLQNFDVGFDFYARSVRDAYETKYNYRMLMYRKLIDQEEEKFFSNKRSMIIKNIENIGYKANIPLVADFAGRLEFGLRRYFVEVYANSFF